jgi:SAM-dependent methyltransferase
MDKQDFEAYALAKPFNPSVAATWLAAFGEALRRLERSPDVVRVLDYGCGDGKYFHTFLEAGLCADHVHGIDVSKLRVERCQQMGWHHARVIEPGARLPYADGTFDLINCMEVIEHIPAREGARVIEDLRRVLRPGGLLMISTPNYPIKRFYDFCDAFLLGKWGRLHDDPTHVTRFSNARLSALLRPHFTALLPRQFKPGFLYARFPHPFFQHKLFFLCCA